MTLPAPLIVFDLDGTLAETAGDLLATLDVILARDGVPPLDPSAARALLGAGARALIERGYAVAGRSLDPAQRERLFQAFLSHYDAHICEHTHLFPGVETALDRLDAAGWRLAVCTNKMEASALALLRALGIERRFAAICGQDTFATRKPDPQALLSTVARAGGDPARTIMVGDSLADIATARGAGIPVIAVDFGYTDTPVTALDPTTVISHFDALFEAVQAIAIVWQAARPMVGATGIEPVTPPV